MQIGDTVMVVPQTLYSELYDKPNDTRRPMAGAVMYIHPKGRFFVVEFSFKLGHTVREAFDSRPTYKKAKGARLPYGKRVIP